MIGTREMLVMLDAVWPVFLLHLLATVNCLANKQGANHFLSNFFHFILFSFVSFLKFQFRFTSTRVWIRIFSLYTHRVILMYKKSITPMEHKTPRKESLCCTVRKVPLMMRLTLLVILGKKDAQIMLASAHLGLNVTVKVPVGSNSRKAQWRHMVHLCASKRPNDNV